MGSIREELVSKMTEREYDFEVAMLLGALKSFKQSSLVNPFPKYFVENGERKHQKLTEAAEGLPSASQLFSQEPLLIEEETQQVLKHIIDHANIKEVPVIPSEYSAPELVPQLVFEVSETCPAKRKEFAEVSENYEVLKGFHGSALCNWYCISKGGLRNFSGTKRESHGSLFGEGIYLSHTLRLACDFSSSAAAWKRCNLGSYLRIIASCDWITTPETTKASSTVDSGSGTGGKVPDAYIVVPNAAHVRVHRLLVYSAKDAVSKSAWRFTSVWMIIFYAFLLFTIVMSQVENRALARSMWRSVRLQTRFLTKYFY
eukprot:TRINITY_DN7003_c0_g2_i2.p1 TRINITY_DN7003_c0_g2~~TRINITY_DN7003_c0_g2_i2.p1  ORF type:complete len:315 (+),score=37.64 TRINITY_DN7003_c0_g2_i2:128-1072(+)